jgi:hypothetical protein
MGLPAVRIDQRAVRAKRSHLRVVGRKPRVAASVKRSSAARAESARSVFRTFAILVTLVAVLGMGRVWLSVKAAEASMAASRLRTAIKNERYAGDMLEVRQSALGSPSRIRAIAGAAMDMAPARKVTYLDIAPDRVPRPVREEGHSNQAGFSRAVSAMMDLTAGEAQVLLVGDVGLASSK